MGYDTFPENPNKCTEEENEESDVRDTGVFSTDQKMIFKDISNEKVRMYLMSVGNDIIIDEPIAVNINDADNHRVVCETGMSFYIPRARDGKDGWTSIC